MILFTAVAQAVLAKNANHVDHAARTGRVAQETGQDAFAALDEIVEILRADPGTDWAQVSIGALRQHLQDMQVLTLMLEVREVPVTDGLRMFIPRRGAGGGAAGRMVPAHAPFVAAETGWSSEIVAQDDALVWTVTSVTASAQIRGLGFFGLMTVGNHHSLHHMMLARGSDPHR